ncbi:MAG TPA: ATP-binding protein [Vicinamibacterales bacterium]|nr:ATP-binding protein [Vicinamibacterales bacterium]
MTRSVPLRVQLTAWYGSILAVTLALVAGLAWLAMRVSLYSAIDADLRDRAVAAAGNLDQEVRQHGRGDLPAHLLEHAGGDAWQIRASDGTWLYRTPAAAENDTPLSLAPPGRRGAELSNIAVGRSRFRAAAAASATDDEGRTYTVQLLEPLDPVDNALAWFARTMALASPVLLVVACGGGYWISGRALSPVDRITRTAQVITAQNLSDRIPIAGAGDELQRLTITLNGMLDRLEGAFERIAQFTADASHELRTPVAFIRTTADVLLRRPRNDDEWRDGVREIQSESARMTELLDNLLTLARADAGSERCVLEPVDLNDLVAEACRAPAALAQLKGLTFAAPKSAPTIEVRGDALLLLRLFVILLDNAVKYTSTGGQIVVAVEAGTDAAVVVIRDTGIGMSEEDVPKIFDRFYRSDKARSRDSGGSGLGLAIARWIVDVHRGSIVVQSRLGAGSEFRVTLPV